MTWIKSVINLYNSQIVLTLVASALLAVGVFTKNLLVVSISLWLFLVYLAIISKRKFRDYLIILAALLFAVCISELALKLNSWRSNLTLIGWSARDSNQLFFQGTETWGLKPNQSLRHVHDMGEYDYMISTVDCGLFAVRGKCPIEPTVWHFGDSFAFGFGVGIESIFTQKISNPDNSVNFAVPGFSSFDMVDQAILVLQSKHSSKPNQLLFHFFLGNDIGEALSREGNLNSQGLVSGFHRVIVKTKIYELLNKSLIKVEVGRKGLPTDIYWVPGHVKEIGQEFWDSRRSLFLTGLDERFNKLRTLYSGEIVVSFIPPKEICLYDRGHWAVITSEIRGVLDKYQISTADFASTYKCPDLLAGYYAVDTHFNELGHQMMADFINAKKY
jgi:hypothetical protein